MKLFGKIDDTIYSYATVRQQEVIDVLRKFKGSNPKV
jgi:hypothetical protein